MPEYRSNKTTHHQCPDDDGGGMGCFGEVAVAAFSKYGQPGGGQRLLYGG